MLDKVCEGHQQLRQAEKSYLLTSNKLKNILHQGSPTQIAPRAK